MVVICGRFPPIKMSRPTKRQLKWRSPIGHGAHAASSKLPPLLSALPFKTIATAKSGIRQAAKRDFALFKRWMSKSATTAIHLNRDISIAFGGHRS